MESLAKAAETEKDLTESNARLNNHIADLESRKRAPLYQKKQEEELRAVTEKAQEAEIRAQEAEVKFKEAKVIGHKHKAEEPEFFMLTGFITIILCSYICYGQMAPKLTGFQTSTAL